MRTWVTTDNISLLFAFIAFIVPFIRVWLFFWSIWVKLRRFWDTFLPSSFLNFRFLFFRIWWVFFIKASFLLSSFYIWLAWTWRGFSDFICILFSLFIEFLNVFFCLMNERHCCKEERAKLTVCYILNIRFPLILRFIRNPKSSNHSSSFFYWQHFLILILYFVKHFLFILR